MNALPSIPALLLQTTGSTSSMLIPMVVMVAIFYLVLFLPMRRRQKKLDELLSNLKAGDKVVTNAGLIGVITGLTESTVTLRVKPDNIKIEFARSAVSGIAEEENKA